MSGTTSPILSAPWMQNQGAAANPLGMMGDIMRLQQTQQELMFKRNEFQARQQLGHVMAASPDMETALDTARRDPLVSQYPQLMTEMRNQRLLDTQTRGAQIEQQGALLGQAKSGREALNQAFVMAGNDPDKLEAALSGTFGALPKSVQAQNQPYLDTLRTSLNAGMEGVTDPAQRASIYAHNRAGLMVAAGIKPEEAGASTDRPYLAPQVARLQQPSGAEPSTVVGGFQGGPGSLGQGAGVPSGSVNLQLSPGQTTEQKEYATERTKTMAGYQEHLDNRVSSGLDLMPVLQEGRDLLTQTAAGGGASFYAGLAKLAQALGFDSQKVDRIAGGNLAAAQEFQKLAPTMAMGQLRQQIPEGSRLNRQEWEGFQRANPSIDMDPRAIDKIFNFWTRLHVRDRIEQQQMNDYLKEGGKLSDWPEAWSRRAQQMGLTGPAFKSAEGKTVRPEDLNTLLDNPGAVEDFDTHYGRGAAAAFLNLRGAK